MDGARPPTGAPNPAQKEADRQLNGVDVSDQVLFENEVAKLDVIGERRPRCEGQKGRPERNPRLSRDAQGLSHVGRRVTFLELLQNPSTQRLHGRDDEKTAEAGQLGESLPVLENVLDLGGDVERDRGMLLVQGFDDGHRVAGAVQEIGIAESDVASARLDLLPGVAENDLSRHDEEAPFVDGGDRTVPTAMQAPSLASTYPTVRSSPAVGPSSRA